MSRYQAMFDRLADAREGAIVPFCVLGDPDESQTLEIVDALVSGGADGLELGFPFSDPVADGPVIQAAAVRALSAGASTEGCMRLIKKIRAAFADLPLGVLVYSNLVQRPGPAEFFARLSAAGADSVLIADLPSCEVAPYAVQACEVGLAPVMIVPPNISESALQIVAKFGAGYSYVLGRPGVTGTEFTPQRPDADLLARLAQMGAPPPLVGFGISTPEHARAALDAGARGAIVGSAIVKLIAEHESDSARRRDALIHFVGRLKEATTESNAGLKPAQEFKRSPLPNPPPCGQ